MQTLEHWQKKIQDKRKQTPFREFLREIASWNTVNLYRNHGQLSRYPDTWREGTIVDLKDYDPQNIEAEEYASDSFFQTLTSLFKKQPKMRLMQRFENENSDFAEVYGGKNCYLCIGVWGVENAAYSTTSYGNLHNIYNAFSILWTVSNVYSSRIVTESHNVFYSSNIHASANVWFSNNLHGCQECLLCDGLDNKSYCIENVQYSKEEYMQKKMAVLSERAMYHTYHQRVLDHLLENKASHNVTGGGIVGSQNIEQWYFVRNLSDGKNLIVSWWDLATKSFYDCVDCGNEWDADLYGVHYCGEKSSGVYCSSSLANCSQVYYSYFMESCSYCVWCVGLKNKSYCIFNKQYEKEEWYERVDAIFEAMEHEWTLGQFLPATMNPFYFNDTAAYLIDSTFTKEEVTALWYMRRDEPIKVDVPERMEVVSVSELNQYETIQNGERYIDPLILKKVIVDNHGNSYRVIKMEYDFLMKYWLPLPRKHWLERMKDNFRL